MKAMLARSVKSYLATAKSTFGAGRMCAGGRGAQARRMLREHAPHLKRKALPNPGLQHRCRSARHGDGRPLAASPCNAGAPRSTRTEGLLCLPSGAHRTVQSRPRTAQRHPHR
ncbi:hypothetical protein CDAR_597531 [Caerostris darwini]|uniref:Uncharacterized protein n=1 Tax=Caerostris darwini TaxID=1538125 RepID=A0AAV4TUX1_9ARAC|nr:hypothetical protein CDAR_597531 [Caerostris darwini]